MISYWRNPMTVASDIERTGIDEFIERVKEGEYKTFVELIRNEQDKEKRKTIKAQLPCVTIAGTFSKRNQSGQEKHSGFICIDIDDFTDRKRIESDEYTYAAFWSVSGRGLAVICKVNPDKHKESYDFAEKHYFEKYGIVVDPAPKNIASCRYVSYDPDLYLNKKAKKLKYTLPKAKKPSNLSIIVPRGEVGDLVNQVNRSVVDEYADYLSLSFALVDGFQEDGRRYFHALASKSEKYSQEQADRQYDIALKRKSTGVTVGTFYYFLKEGGADLAKFKSDAAVSEAKINKRLNVPKEAATLELMKSTKIDKEHAAELVEEIYRRNDVDIRNERGVENIITNLTTYIEKKYKIRRNAITRKYEINGQPMTEKDFNNVYLDARILFDDSAVTFDLCTRIIVSDVTPEYNPLFNYVEQNKHRISNGNVDKICFSIESDTMIKDVLIRKWLISIIAAMYGNPVRSVLSLTGGQNTGKTEWFRRLLPSALKPYYAESNLDRGKDDELLMCEKLMVMDDEMGGKSKNDEKRFKELTSKSVFSLRSPYGKFNEDYSRLAILCGTSNDHQLINDSTGNTRVLPVEVITINHELYNSVDKDDLFMELHRMYTSGEPWQLDETELSILKEISGQFEHIRMERELIHQFFKAPEKRGEWMTATEIKNHIEMFTKQKIMSLKNLGLELKNAFGDKVAKGKSYKYWVEKLEIKIDEQKETHPWLS